MPYMECLGNDVFTSKKERTALVVVERTPRVLSHSLQTTLRPRGSPHKWLLKAPSFPVNMVNHIVKSL